MKKTLILLVCLLLIGSAGVALAGNGSPAPPRDGAVEWVLDWLDSLVDQARGALSGSMPVAETHRAEAQGPSNAADSEPSQPAASSTESGADDGEDGIPELGPLAEPAG